MKDRKVEGPGHKRDSQSGGRRIRSEDEVEGPGHKMPWFWIKSGGGKNRGAGQNPSAFPLDNRGGTGHHDKTTKTGGNIP